MRTTRLLILFSGVGVVWCLHPGGGCLHQGGIEQTPSPVNRQTGVKTLPCPRLHLRAVNIYLNTFGKHCAVFLIRGEDVVQASHVLLPVLQPPFHGPGPARFGVHVTGEPPRVVLGKPVDGHEVLVTINQGILHAPSDVVQSCKQTDLF